MLPDSRPVQFENLQLVGGKPALAKAAHREELRRDFESKPLAERLLLTIELMNLALRDGPTHR